MKLEQLRTPFSNLQPSQRLSIIREVRASRLVVKAPKTTARKKIHKEVRAKKALTSSKENLQFLIDQIKNMED